MRVPEQKNLLIEIISLPEKWKTALLQRYVEGYPIKDVALITGLSENAIKNGCKGDGKSSGKNI